MVYIDGFNLYFGMTSRFQGVKWLDVYRLASSLLKPYQELQGVKYFTSRLSNNPAKERRQSTYLNAIKTTPTEIIYGNFKAGRASCNRCGHSWNSHEEKKTDVNIAVDMLTDALEMKYDTALLISGDSDLVPAISAVKEKFHKRVVVGFPPDRYNVSIKNIANGSFIIGRQKLREAQFPDVVLSGDGFPLHTPVEWY